MYKINSDTVGPYNAMCWRLLSAEDIKIPERNSILWILLLTVKCLYYRFLSDAAC